MTEAYSSGGWSVHNLDSVDSTQKWVKDRISALSDRSVVLARSQTSGRGRTGRAWQSPPGGFYSSLLLKPAPPLDSARCVSLLVAFCIVRIMRRRGIPALVKWPNDVVAEGRKLAGIIAETGNHPVSWFTLGTGINLESTPEVPGRKILPAGSWKLFQEPPSAGEILNDLLCEIDSLWRDRSAHPLIDVIHDVNDCLWSKGKVVKIEAGHEQLKGILGGIRSDGALILSTDSGERRFVSGELLTVHGESMET